MHSVESRTVLRLATALAVVVASLCAYDASAAGKHGGEDARIADLDVVVWKPESGAGLFPLVLFSHGLYGCSTQSSYLMRALAEHGMLVVAPNHKDNYERCPALPDPVRLPPGFADPANWTPTFQAERGDDLRKLRRALETDDTYSALFDPARVALVGHSLGGYTVLALAGAWPGWTMTDLTAVVALASYAQPLLGKGSLANVSVPMLVQGGKADWLTPQAVQEKIYDGITGRGCEVIYEDAGHFAWTDRDTVFQDANATAIVAFLKAAFDVEKLTAEELTAALPSSPGATTRCK